MLADVIYVAILLGNIMMVGNLGGRGGTSNGIVVAVVAVVAKHYSNSGEIKRLDKIFYKGGSSSSSSSSGKRGGQG